MHTLGLCELLQISMLLIHYVFCFSRSVGKFWPNQCGEPITSNTWPLTLTLKAWPLCLLERRRTRWSFLRVLCRSKGNTTTTLLRQAGWRNHQYFLFFLFFVILWNSASSYSLKTADGNWRLHFVSYNRSSSMHISRCSSSSTCWNCKLYTWFLKNDVQSLLQISRLAGRNQHVFGGGSIV